MPQIILEGSEYNSNRQFTRYLKSLKAKLRLEYVDINKG
jgi:hypothetical protein